VKRRLVPAVDMLYNSRLAALAHLKACAALSGRCIVKRFNRRLAVVLGLCALATVLAAAQADRATAQKYPPQFPREGATKLFENDKVIVWEQIGRPKAVFMHKHIRDILNFVIEPGGGIGVLNPDGSKGGGSPLTQTIYKTNSITYTKAGLGPHAEVMSDPANPGRSIFVEIKGTEPADCRQWSTACP
jgi:hypothetical protein